LGYIDVTVQRNCADQKTTKAGYVLLLLYLSNENGTVDDKHVEMIESGRDDGTISFTGMNAVSIVIIVPIKTGVCTSNLLQCTMMGGKNPTPHWQLIYEPSSGWEVNGDGGVGLCIVLDHDRADHKTLADHKLFVQRVRFIVLWELVPHRPHNWCSLGVGL
jgi:hypothetical protein